MRREVSHAIAMLTVTTVALTTEVRILSTKTVDCSSTFVHENFPTATVGYMGTSSVSGQSNNIGATNSASDNIATASGLTWMPSPGSAIQSASQGPASEATQTPDSSSTTKTSPSGTTVVQVPTSASKKIVPVFWLSGTLAALTLIM
ncbi:hypothetical protein CSIM01_04288 [Colletotrichum simmondsii]|uniref:Uncharacterized protein n=1 Tax=Colletotrichum simmondsii TaxID=703756 RepID=A0A135SA49_9PEZI|nr:hypothetical protein CSIM01_04288 [Colletotrichum simmondsii]